ncbi:hypothetical protein [Aestuariispira ectoiniformans]|uniref:hypothetical protein n=1 Tax=Aestuariispira ectoiniformans TaxID=2775080 RepID=UPI00223AB1B1|nr:hypothetical protein [Aestuariispira ectoiniformans]
MTGYSRAFLLCAIVYAILGMGVGIHMAASNDFTLGMMHAHINLVGWVTMGLFGLVYAACKGAAAHKLVPLHFWVANIGVIIMAPGIGLIHMGNTEAGEPLAIAGSLLTILSMLIFGWIILRSGKQA